jgi:hypothetical protein
VNQIKQLSVNYCPISVPATQAKSYHRSHRCGTNESSSFRYPCKREYQYINIKPAVINTPTSSPSLKLLAVKPKSEVRLFMSVRLRKLKRAARYAMVIANQISNEELCLWTVDCESQRNWARQRTIGSRLGVEAERQGQEGEM